MNNLSRKLDFNAGKHWEGQFRDAKGRFCTAATYKVEKTRNDNKRLRLECERYKRMYLAVVKEYQRLLRENESLKNKLKEYGFEHCFFARENRE